MILRDVGGKVHSFSFFSVLFCRILMMLIAVSLYNVSLGEEKSPDRVDGNQAVSSNVELVG